MLNFSFQITFLLLRLVRKYIQQQKMNEQTGRRADGKPIALVLQRQRWGLAALGAARGCG